VGYSEHTRTRSHAHTRTRTRSHTHTHAHTTQLGNVAMPPPRPAAYVERHLPPRGRDNALVAPGMRMSLRKAPAGPVAVSQPTAAAPPAREATLTPSLEGW
jgi:hypothetical protein